MAEIWEPALELASSDPTTFAIILISGILIHHVINAFLYGIIYKFPAGKLSFEKIKIFFKYLFFIPMQ